LAAPPQALAEALRDPAGLRRFLGLAGGLPGQDAGALGDGPSYAAGHAAGPALAALIARAEGAEWHQAAEGFLDDLAGLAVLGPPARAAAALALWQGAGLGPMLEGVVLASRIAALPDGAIDGAIDDADSRGAKGGAITGAITGSITGTITGATPGMAAEPAAGPAAGLTDTALGPAALARGMPAPHGPVWARFLPLGALPLPARQGRARAADRLAALITAATAQLPICLAGLSRRRDWAAAAAAALPGGKVARAALPLICHEALVSANLLRDRLGVSQQAANAALHRLAALGLIEELSGQQRYRLWRARL
ncbi:MAG: helix-turn-helix domain-containing protein, partial [Pseudomonadota bacterium]